MAGERIALVESAARLSVDRGRIKIERRDEMDCFIAPDDLAFLCLDHYAIEITKQALFRLTEASAALIVTDGSHLPAAILLPLQANGFTARRIHQQVTLASTDGAGRLWAQIVAAKIRTQAATLRRLECNGALRLERMAKDVTSGDPKNLEAQAAKHYWAHLFPEGFHREKRNALHPLNQKLNYGYAVLRALIARQIAMAGLSPALGLGHRSTENPFNLADDFIEPYRFIVETIVKAQLSAVEPICREDRHELLGIVEAEVPMHGQTWRLTSAVEETIESFCRCLTSDSAQQLSLPG